MDRRAPRIVSGLFGVAIVVAWGLAGSRGSGRRLTGALTLTGMLVGIRGIPGLVQYGLDLPDALVWLHVSLATLTWYALLWARQLSGRPGATVAAILGDHGNEAASPDRAGAPAVTATTAHASARPSTAG